MILTLTLKDLILIASNRSHRVLKGKAFWISEWLWKMLLSVITGKSLLCVEIATSFARHPKGYFDNCLRCSVQFRVMLSFFFVSNGCVILVVITLEKITLVFRLPLKREAAKK